MQISSSAMVRLLALGAVLVSGACSPWGGTCEDLTREAEALVREFKACASPFGEDPCTVISQETSSLDCTGKLSCEVNINANRVDEFRARAEELARRSHEACEAEHRCLKIKCGGAHSGACGEDGLCP